MRLAFVFLSVVVFVSALHPVFVRAETKGKKRFGIENRIPWTTTRITGSPEPPAPYSTERVFPQLQFADPVTLTTAPGSDRLFVVQLRGKIVSFQPKADVKETDLFFDLAKSVEGFRRVYDLTFHPNFAENGLCYICYVLKENDPNGTHVSEFKVIQDDPPRVDPASERILLTWFSGGHNGCCLKFGPDGFLYVSTGDAGPAFPPDPKKSGQDVSNLLSSILRIDIDKADAGKLYRIPDDNPFVNLPGARGEVWAYGLRNPWRMSFDPANGDLWVGDVGWELWEMIYRIKRGGNYGWSLVEGRQPVHRERQRGPTPILPPTVEHSHIESRSITGGYVYHGKRYRELDGVYIYGDYVTGKIWGIRHNGEKVTWLKELVDTPFQIITFGVDYDQELLIVAYDGMVHRLIPSPKAGANLEFPQKLSETGLFDSVKDHTLASGVIPYSINAEPWADGTSAERFIALPETTKLEVFDSSNVQVGFIKGHWKFPTDSVLVKTISLEMQRGNPKTRRRLETQIMHFDVDTWRPYTYVWNDEQTEATLAPAEGLKRTFSVKDSEAPQGVRKLEWRFAGRSECLLCHTTRGGSIYGFQPAQLNKVHDYDGVVADQLRTLEHIGLFETPLEKELPKIPNPHDESVNINDRARAYLHVNCSHCHLRGGGGTAAIEIQYDRPLDKTNLLNARPTQGTFGMHAAQVLATGDPYRSVLYYRMAKLGRGRMPYFGSSIVDEKGLKLIHDWIGQLEMPDGQAPSKSAANLRSQQKTLLRNLVGDADSEKAIRQLLSSTSGALQLLNALESKRLSNTRDNVLAQATAHDDIRVRDLFERFLPEDQRTKRLGSVVDSQSILAIKGSVEQGRVLFLNTAGIQCKSCHRIGDQGIAVGPDLTQIAKKYDRAQLLETILEPSKRIEPQFVTYLIETVQGRVLSGLLVKKTEKEIVLKTAQNKVVRIPVDDVELMTPQQKSIMPELLLQDMTAEQVADLLAFLSSLK